MNPILGAYKAKTEVYQYRKLTYPQTFPLLDDCSDYPPYYIVANLTSVV